ncbi:MAG: radical SAM protein [Euryarchaeota archaeon]|nr:radical SAM protein [Euryarchaeota archaeon]
MFDLDFFIDGSGRKDEIKVKVYEAKCSVALPKSSLPGLDLALNPYVGCEHGCLYCFAPDIVKRPRETWATEVGYRSNIPVLLNKELRTKRGTIGIGTVTDPYQPLEKVLLLTRKCLMEIVRHDNPISVQTKSDLVLRDIELISSSARPEVGITITTSDESLALKVEPGAPSPRRRLEALSKISEQGINCYAMIGPVLPFVGEEEVTSTLEAIGSTGCRRVMVDRLRMRPGLEEAFLGSKVVWTTGCLTDTVRMGTLSRYVRDECVRMGLKFETAF